jgi:outer membrane lipoprotein carrier protein
MKISFFKSLVTLLVLVSFTKSIAQNATTKAKATAILDAVSKKYAAIPGFNASFTYGADGAKAGMKGDVTVKNKKFRLKLAGQEIYNNGATVSTYIKETNEVNISTFDPAEEGINPAKIYTIYKKGYNYNFVGETKEGAATYENVELIPQKANGQVKKLLLVINKVDKSVKSWKITGKDNKVQTFRIDKFTPNKTLTDAYFTFDKKNYPGVEVIDLR